MTQTDKYDGLTGLFNRTSAVLILEEETKRASSKKLTFSLATVDIDLFKKIDDRIGHKAGDNIIKQFSEILKKNCRTNDVVARMGGEDFLIFLPETEKEEALILLEDIRRLISAKAFKFINSERNTEEVKLTFSAGIASYPKDGCDVTTLLRNVDSALVMAKKFGRDRVCLAVEEKMILKSNYYTKGQLDRLSRIASEADLTESYLLREALDYIIEKYEGENQKKHENLKLRKSKLSIEDIEFLPNSSIQILLKEIDNRTLILSLLKMSQKHKNLICRNISERGLKHLESDLKEAKEKNIDSEQSENAKLKIVAIMNNLSAKGKI